MIFLGRYPEKKDVNNPALKKTNCLVLKQRTIQSYRQKQGRLFLLEENGIEFLRNNYADLLNNLQEKINQFVKKTKSVS